MENTIFSQTQTPLQLLKKNAPYVYMRYVTKKKYELNNELVQLRHEYKFANKEVRLEIIKKAEYIKNRLKELNSECENHNPNKTL